MSNNYCKACEVYIPNKYSFIRHTESKKHLDMKVKDEEVLCVMYKCKFCDKMYKHKFTLTAHLKGCSRNTVEIITQLKEKCEVLEEDNKILQKDKKVLTEKVEKITNDYIDVTKSQNRTYETTISLLKLLITKYADAPEIQPPKNICDMMENEEIEKQVMSRFRKGELAQYLGDLIIAEYKKKDQSQQSVWISDVNRLTCVVKEKKWKRDPKGVEVIRIIISEVIDKVIAMTKIFLQKCRFIMRVQHSVDHVDNNFVVSKNCYLWEMKYKDMAEWAGSALDILNNINTHYFKNIILKYIAPSFNIIYIDVGDGKKSQKMINKIKKNNKDIENQKI